LFWYSISKRVVLSVVNSITMSTTKSIYKNIESD